MGTKIRISRVVKAFFFFFSPSFPRRTAELPSLCKVISSIYQRFVPQFTMAVFICIYHRRRSGRGRGSGSPPKRNLGGGVSPPRFGPEDIGNAAENWFGKLFRLVIFSQIVSQWSRLGKYYFLGLFEQLYPDFEKPINCCLFCH